MSKKAKIIIAVAVLLLGAGGAFAFWRSQQPQETFRTAVAERGTLTKDIAFTGRLEAATEATLGFTTPGTIAEITVQEGDHVTAGQVLARLDSRTEELEIAAARADKVSAQESARLAWEKAEVEGTRTQAENARLLEQRRQTVRDAKEELEQAQEIWQQRVRDEGDDSLGAKTAFASIVSAESAYHAAQQALKTTEKTVAKQDESLKRAADIAEAEYHSTVQAAGNVAGLSSLEAREALAEVQLSKNTLTAPFSGVVTKLDAVIGELATATTPVITMQTVDTLVLTADVLESDAITLTPGMRATVTFDALPAIESWSATLTRLSPAAEIVEGIPTYEIALALTSTDTRFKPGLTANITVHANQKDNVITVPRRAVIMRDDKEYVRVLVREGVTEEKEVTTGLVGSDGQVEIMSGLSGGEQVITSTTDSGQ